MKDDAELVEYIVREVIRRLLASGHSVSPVPGSAPTTKESGLNLAERIVTVATLQGKLDGVKRVTVSRRAVVTPSAKDELKHRQIELTRN